MTLLARTKFFGGGHKLSGLDPEHLGVTALPGSRSRRQSVPRPAMSGEGA
jgi:preprotein translocase subunit SecD